MAFKTFTAGSVLTAAEVNDYLMKQTVIVCTSGTRPSSPVEGMHIYETDTDKMYVHTGAAWKELGLFFNPPACRVHHNAAQSIPHNTDTAVTFNSERYDTAALHDTGTNPTRITFPVAGIYLITFNGEFAAGADYTQTFCYIRLGGATIIGFGDTGAANTVSEARFVNVATTYKFAAAEYVEVVVKHINGAAAARNLNTAANRSPEFAATWVGVG